MRKGNIEVDALSGDVGKLVELDTNGKLIASSTTGSATFDATVVRASSNAGYSLGTTGTYIWRFEDEDQDTCGCWSTNAFTPDNTSLYLITGVMQLQNGSSSVSFVDVRLRIGASTYRQWMNWETVNSSSATPIVAFSGTFYLTSSQTVYIAVDISAASTCSQSTSSVYNFINITRVG